MEREVKLIVCERAVGGKESERSNRLADSVMRCCFEKRHPVSCCSNHLTPSESSLDLGEIVPGSCITPFPRTDSYVICS